MKTSRTLSIAALSLTMAACGSALNDRIGNVVTPAADPARYIAIDVEDLEQGLPCRVIDHAPSGAQDVLWSAEFERGFCQQKAEETRFILRTKGWACQLLSPRDRNATVGLDSPRTVAAWRCLEKEAIEPVAQPTLAAPWIPIARPDRLDPPPPLEPAEPSPEPVQSDRPQNSSPDLLDVTVERDLTAIGQDVASSEASLAKAVGDLNDDGADDAVIVLTRGADREIPHRMLLAYLREGEDYKLVDVWILRPPIDGQSGQLALAIEDGTVQLGDCCGDRNGPTVLVLNGRKLAHIDGG